MAELQADTLNIPHLMLEKLRCSICKRYLSCSPLYLSQDGSCICRDCSPLNSNKPVYRMLLLEEMLRKISFPCRFKEHGCTENFLFNTARPHQYECMYRPVPCPLLKTCAWKGLASQLYDHFTKKHGDFIKEKAEFNFDVDKNSEGVLMTIEDSLIFVIKYIYNASKTNLKYDISCANEVGYNVSFKSKLINASDTSDYYVGLITNECFSYDGSFYKMEDAMDLNINKFMDCLGNPKSIIVVSKLKIVKTNNSGKIENDLNVNFDSTDSLKCHSCDNYLIPPLYDLDDHIICSDCSENNSSCTPSNDTNLLKHVKEALYPCRWRDCNFTSKSETFKDHESTCQFRRYDCLDCDDYFTLSKAVDHFQKVHNLEYLTGEVILYKTSLAKSYENEIITLKDNIPILIGHSTRNSTHCVDIFKMYGHLIKVTGTIQFEHQHCRLKSKQFTTDHDCKLNVTLNNLPPCFKEHDELSVTVKLKIE